jgi:hypothetical protein
MIRDTVKLTVSFEYEFAETTVSFSYVQIVHPIKDGAGGKIVTDMIIIVLPTYFK